MSCNLNTVSHLEVPVELQKWLCPHLIFSETSTPSQNHFDPFPDTTLEENCSPWKADDELAGTGVKSNNLSDATQQGNSNDVSWLMECLVSVSPVGDVVAIAREDRICVFTGVWEVPEEEEERLVLRLSWKGRLGINSGDITFLLCLPVCSLQRSSAGAPDFMSLLVCHEHGPVCWYTQSGALLLQKQFEGAGVGAVAAVLSSDCGSDGTEWLALLYPRCTVTLDTRHLATVLRLCVAKLARDQAGSPPPGSHSPALPYHKWALSGARVRALGVAGARETRYDAMALGALQHGGQHDSLLLVAGGEEPYVGVAVGRQQQEGGMAMGAVARQLASAVTNRVLSVASSWIPFVGTKAADEKVQEKVEPGVAVPYSWCLPAPCRAVSVTLSPDARLVALTDTYGRVVLVDVRGGYAIRMWKGYREAVVGWLAVQGACSTAADVSRRSLLLVIHAPRRGLLEVWPAQHGHRVAAFNVARGARLLYNNHGLMGGAGASTASDRQYSLLLLCPDGAVQRLVVPFHLLLGGRSGERARDLHNHASLKAAVRAGDAAGAAAACGRLSGGAARLQALAFLSYSPCVFGEDMLHAVLREMWPLYFGRDMDDEGDTSSSSNSASSRDASGPTSDRATTAAEPYSVSAAYPRPWEQESVRVQRVLRSLRQLMLLHRTVYAFHPKGEDVEEGDDPQEVAQEVCHRLCITPAQLHSLMSALDDPPDKPGKQVTFSDSGGGGVRVNLAWFLRSFVLGVSRERPQQQPQLSRAQLALKDLGSRALTASGAARGHKRTYGGRRVAPSVEEEAQQHEKEVDGEGVVPISLQEQLSSDRKAALSRFLFGWPWSRARSALFHDALLHSGVDAKALLKLLLHYWCHDDDVGVGVGSSRLAQPGNRPEAGDTSVNTVTTAPEAVNSGSDVQDVSEQPESYTAVPEAKVRTTFLPTPGDALLPDAPLYGDITPEMMARMTSTLKMASLITSLTSVREGEVRCSALERSKWWCSVRGRLVSWTPVSRAYLVALLCRAVNNKLEDRQRQEREEEQLLQEREEEQLLQERKEEQEQLQFEREEQQQLQHEDQTMREDPSAVQNPPGAVEEMTVQDTVLAPGDVDGRDGEVQNSQPPHVFVDLFTDVSRDVARELQNGRGKVVVGAKYEWEGCSAENSEWAVLLGQLEKLLPVERLLKLRLGCAKIQDCEVSIKMLLDKGKGGVSEVVSRWLVHTGLLAADLSTLTLHVDRHVQHSLLRHRHETEKLPVGEEEPDDDSPQTEDSPLLQPRDVVHWGPTLADVYEHLLAVARVFPHSSSREAFQAGLAWECAAEWQRGSAHGRAPELLQRAADLAADIPNCHVKHGVCALVWEKWVSAVLRRVSECMGRSGGVPYDAGQCQRRLKMTRHAVPSFLAAARSILTCIMESNVLCEVQKPHVPNVDTFWQHILVETGGDRVTQSQFGAADSCAADGEEESRQLYDAPNLQHNVLDRFLDRRGDGRRDVPDSRTRSEGPKSLCEVAVLQRATSYDLVFVHTQLCDALHLVAQHDMHGVAVTSFFNDRVRCVLHKSLHLQWSLGAVDEAPSITGLRIKFLCAAITHAIGGMSDAPTWQEFQSCGAKEALSLGQLWGVAQDHLYRHQVIELYSFGHDYFAQDCIRLVSQGHQLGQSLLLLAGCRYKARLDASDRPAPLTVALGANIAQWVKSLDADQLKNPMVSVSQSVELVNTAMRLLPSQSADHTKADSLLYAFRLLKEQEAAT